MATRGGTRKRNVEEMVAYFYGINQQGNVISLAVYRKGKSVRLSGQHGSHLVHPSNVGSLEGWKREAALVWNLTNIFDTPPQYLNSENVRAKLDELKRMATERKKQPSQASNKKGE